MIRPDGDRSAAASDNQNGDDNPSGSGFVSGSKLLAAEEQLDEDLGEEPGYQNQDTRQSAEQLEDQEEMQKIFEVLQRLDAPAISQRIKYIENWAAVLTIQENEILQEAVKLNILGPLQKNNDKS